MPTILIDEEYGFRYWTAVLTEIEYQDLLRRWATMRGLNCLVPVPIIIPQAQLAPEDLPLLVRDAKGRFPVRCHIHECDDSHLDGSDYTIPEDTLFWIDGKSYDTWNDF